MSLENIVIQQSYEAHSILLNCKVQSKHILNYEILQTKPKTMCTSKQSFNLCKPFLSTWRQGLAKWPKLALNLQ